MNENIASTVAKLKFIDDECEWRRHITALIPIAAVYLALAFYQLDDQSLWTDEVISLNRWSAADPLWKRLYSQSPLYFVLLGLWSEFGANTEFAFRSFSTLLGVAVVCLTYVIGFRLLNRKTAIFGAILLATSPYLIWYAQEVRYVILTVLTGLLMTYSFHRAVSDDLRKWWLLYGATSLMALFSFVTVIFLIMAQGVFVLCSASHRPVLKKWIACQLVSVLCFAIWSGAATSPQLKAGLTKAPSLIAPEQKRAPGALPITDLVGAIPYTFFAFSVGFSLGPSVRELHELRSISTVLSHAPTLVPVGLLFAALFVLGLGRLRRDKSSGVFLLLWLGLPIAGVFVIATTTSYHVYNTRYAAIALPAYILILAAGITTFRRQALQITILSGLLFVNGLSLAHYYFNPRYAREDARSAAQYLESVAQPGDVILAVGSAVALRYYYKGSLPVVLAGAHSANNGLVGHLRNLGKDHRLWLVEIRPWEADPKSKVKAALDNLARRSEDKKFPGVEIYSYQAADRGS
jgi:4-amino-4-deoxy-L-arabinose transferase-like glycosyltransferase